MVLEKKMFLLFSVMAAIFLTKPKFIILKPLCLILLQVKFDNNCLSQGSR